MEKFKVDYSDEGKRLDVVCFEKVLKTNENLTRSQIKNAIDANKITVNGKNQKAGYKVKNGDVINIELLAIAPQNLVKQNLPINIVFEDENYVVINKPQGMVVHPGSGNLDNTLVNALLYKYGFLQNEFMEPAQNCETQASLRPGIVHRIDKNTSGLLVVAKTQHAFKSLSEQIAKHQCKREYVAMCDGVFKETQGTIQTTIVRNKKDKTKMAVGKSNEGKIAITHFKVLKQFEKCALVEFNLETGRTHQIRVHCKYKNHPIVGDEVYGKAVKGLNGQLLHAKKLEFVSPTTNKLVSFECDLPSYFVEYINKSK